MNIPTKKRGEVKNSLAEILAAADDGDEGVSNRIAAEVLKLKSIKETWKKRLQRRDAVQAECVDMLRKRYDNLLNDEGREILAWKKKAQTAALMLGVKERKSFETHGIENSRLLKVQTNRVFRLRSEVLVLKERLGIVTENADRTLCLTEERERDYRRRMITETARYRKVRANFDSLTRAAESVLQDDVWDHIRRLKCELNDARREANETKRRLDVSESQNRDLKKKAAEGSRYSSVTSFPKSRNESMISIPPPGLRPPGLLQNKFDAEPLIITPSSSVAAYPAASPLRENEQPLLSYSDVVERLRRKADLADEEARDACRQKQSANTEIELLRAELVEKDRTLDEFQNSLVAKRTLTQHELKKAEAQLEFAKGEEIDELRARFEACEDSMRDRIASLEDHAYLKKATWSTERQTSERERIARLRDEFAGELRTQRLEHDAVSSELSKMIEKYRVEVYEYRATLEREHRETLRTSREAHLKAIEEHREAALEEAREQHTRELDAAKEAHREHLHRTLVHHQTEAKMEHEDALLKAKEEHRRSMESHRREIEDAVKKEHSQALKRAKEEHQKKLTSAMSFHSTQVKEAKKMAAQANEQKSQLALLRIRPLLIDALNRIRKRRDQLTFVYKEILDTEDHLVQQLDFVQHRYINELLRREKHAMLHRIASMRTLSNRQGSMPDLKIAAANDRPTLRKSKSARAAKLSKPPRLLDFPGTVVRVLKTGPNQYKTGAVVVRDLRTSDDFATKINELDEDGTDDTSVVPPPVTKPPSTPTTSELFVSRRTPSREEVRAARMKITSVQAARHEAQKMLKCGSISQTEYDTMWFVQEETDAKQLLRDATVFVELDESGEVESFCLDEIERLEPKERRTTATFVLSSAEVTKVFGNWSNIRDLHATFLKRLRVIIESDVSSRALPFSHLLSEHVAKLRDPLGAFSAHMCYATPLIEERLKCDKEFRNFCKSRCEIKDSFGLDIEALLIAPIQRTLRYSLLLREVSKALKQKDRDQLISAFEGIKSISKYCDQCVAWERVVILQQKFTSKYPWLRLAVRGRTFIMDGSLVKKQEGHFGTQVSKERYFYLCNDLLFYTSKDGGKEKPRGVFYLKNMRLVVDTFRKGFNVSLGSKHWTFHASSPSDHEVWVDRLRKAIACAANDRSEELACVEVSNRECDIKIYGARSKWMSKYSPRHR
eukprot:g2453.t1